MNHKYLDGSKVAYLSGKKMGDLMDAEQKATLETFKEKGFSFRDGLAIVPADESTIKQRGRDNKHFSDAGAEKIANWVLYKQVKMYRSQLDHTLHK